VNLARYPIATDEPFVEQLPALAYFGLFVESLAAIRDDQGYDTADPAGDDRGDAGQVEHVLGGQGRAACHGRAAKTDPQRQSSAGRDSRTDHHDRTKCRPERPQSGLTGSTKSVHDHSVQAARIGRPASPHV
jgi:hypothetical protein